MIDVLLDTLIDSIKLLPFLFLTYLAMEYLEHKTKDKAKQVIKKAGKFGPVFGGALGVVPQCGFSAAASNLYAGRVISMGTLIAIFLSTSDEMLPILISEAVNPVLILKILGTKLIIGILAGLILDFIIRKTVKEVPKMHIHEMCEHEHCHCEKGIFRSALNHTLQIFFFIAVISLILNILIHYVGEDTLGSIILNQPVFGPMIAGLVGLIPNCAASVILTQLYLEGALGLGSMMAGLLAGSGVGLLVLFRVNSNKKENLRIIGILYGIGVAVGIVMELLKIVF